MPKITIENGTPEGLQNAVSALFGRQIAAAPAVVENAASLKSGTVETSVSVEDGDTVARLFGKGSGDLGIDAGRALTFMDGNGNVIPATTPAKAGESYSVAPNHDPKG